MPQGYAYPEWTGMNMSTVPGPSTPTDPGAGLASAGLLLGMFGAMNSMIGNFYAMKSQQYQLKSQASSMRFQSEMSAMNRRMAEREAEQAMRAGEREIGRYTMEAGQQKAATQASLAARGVQAGVGSAAEQIASQDIISKIDVMTIDSNRVRAANAARMQAVNYANQAMMQGVSAENLMASRRTISPAVGTINTLLGSAGTVASQWAESRRWESYYNRQR